MKLGDMEAAQGHAAEAKQLQQQLTGDAVEREATRQGEVMAKLLGTKVTRKLQQMGRN